MALENMGFKKTKVGLIWERENRRERRRGRGREEEEKKERSSAKIKPTRYGTLDFCMEL